MTKSKSTIKYKKLNGIAWVTMNRPEYNNAQNGKMTYDLDKALREMERVGKKHKYLCVESYRNEKEKANLLYWQVTCEAFNTPNEWRWWFDQTGYSGDYSFIYFE